MYVFPKSEESQEEILSRIVGLIKSSHLGVRKELAQFLGVHPNVITNWMNGRNKSWRSRLDDISKFFCVSLEYLMTGKEPSNEQNEKPPIPEDRELSPDVIREMLGKMSTAELAQMMVEIAEALKKREEN